MEHSKLPFLKWYHAMILFSLSKKGLSAKEIQRQLKSTRYESVWAILAMFVWKVFNKTEESQQVTLYKNNSDFCTKSKASIFEHRLVIT